jgi:hypothetical protein
VTIWYVAFGLFPGVHVRYEGHTCQRHALAMPAFWNKRGTCNSADYPLALIRIVHVRKSNDERVVGIYIC